MTFQAAVEEAASRRSIFWGVVLILLGLAAIFAPAAVSLGAVFVIACLLIVAGITHLLSAWHAGSAGSVLWRVLVGIVYFVAGLAMYSHPLWGTMILTLVVGTVLVTEGIIGVVTYFLLPPTADDTMCTFFGSLTTIFLGLLIWIRWPSSSMWAIGTLIAVNLLIVGTSRVFIAFRAQRLIEG